MGLSEEAESKNERLQKAVAAYPEQTGLDDVVEALGTVTLALLAVHEELSWIREQFQANSL